MKIYIGHSTGFDYKKELYQPLKQSQLCEEHEITFPHDSRELFDSKEFLRKECDLFVAEVSHASTGLGIELGWADSFEIPIICICKSCAEPSSSIQAVTNEVERYENRKELVEIVEQAVER